MDGERQIEGRIAHAHAVERIISYTLRPLLRNGAVVGVVGIAKDVTERRMAERRIEHLAYHDPLTGLPNRRLLDDRLEVAIAQARRDNREIALLFLDLDRFKAINDSLGHRSGDLLLQDLARRLGACVRAGDTIARMGGDEFLLLLPALDEGDRAALVAENILEVVRQPFVLEGREFVVTASIGVSIFPNTASDGDTLIRQADIALLTAKHHGRDTYRLYDEHMSARSTERFELEHDLRRAVRDGEFEMHYQPIVDMRNGSTIALEGLIRWNHPSRGLLMPTVFIDLAEQVGLIGVIGAWALGEVAAQSAAWKRSGLCALPISVNVSARQFDRDIVRVVAAALERAALDPKYLTLELTESVLVESVASSTQTLVQLKELGVQIAIDDFGTGYSSLSYLERFPIDTIKIDRSFIPHDTTNAQSGLIANAIISLGQALGLRVIAEGVETAAQRDFLLARGCSFGQGFFYSSAMSTHEIEPLLNRNPGDGILA